VARDRGKTLVVSTATVALQEQLVTKDLPDLQTKSGMEFTFALAKGRRRYVCDRDLERVAGAQPGQTNLDLGAIHNDNRNERDDGLDDGAVEQARTMWQARQEGTFTGDLDEWGASLGKPLRDAITTD